MKENDEFHYQTLFCIRQCVCSGIPNIDT